MLLATRAIVLTTRAYNDQFAIAHLLTEEEGVIAYRIPHAPRGRSRRSGKYLLQRMMNPLAELAITAEHRPQRSLQQIEQAEYHKLNLNLLLYEPNKVHIAFFLAEALYHILRNAPADPEVYRYVSHGIVQLEETKNSCANFHIAFFLGLLDPLGIFPTHLLDEEPKGWFNLKEVAFVPYNPHNGYSLSPEEVGALTKIRRINYNNMHLFRFTREERKRTLTYLLDYIKLHYAPIGELSSPAILAHLYR